MNRTIKAFLGIFLASAALLLAGCAQTKKSQTPQSSPAQYSGFLGDYSNLSDVTDARGDKVMRYVNPKVQPGEYRAIMIEPTVYYPEPQPTAQVDAATLASIRQYVDTQLQNKLGSRVKLASRPGPGVLRMRTAITAVSGETAALKPYQYIPVAFVVTQIKGRKQTAALQMEVDVTDSMTGERMGAAVRRGEGAQLSGDNQKLTLEDVRPLLDKWAETGATFISQTLK